MADFRKPGGFGGGRGNDRGGSRFPKKDFGRPSFGGDKPRFGGKPSFGNKGGFRGSDDRGGYGARPPVQLFKTTCSQCGKSCEVPFRPTGEKPVYCNECFGATKDREGGGRSFEKREFKPRESFGSRESFTPPAAAPDKRIDDLKRQLDTIQAKLNDIMQLITVTKIGEVVKDKAKEKEATSKKKKVVPAKKAAPKKK